MFDRKAYMREYTPKWRAKNPERYKEQCRRYVARHPGKSTARMARLLKRNPEYFHERWKRESIALTDDYIKRVLCAHSRLGFNDIPKVLIEAKRAELKLRRALKDERYCKA